MATQIQTMSAPLALPNQSSGGIFTNIFRVFFQPKTFFRNMPAGSQWLIAVFLVLLITGLAATTQIQSSTATNSSGTPATTGATTQASSFNLSALSATSSTTAASTRSTATTATGTATTAAAATSTTATVSSDTILMNGLLAVCGVLIMWAGQATALSLVTMLRGYAPQLGKCLQIAVWASLPLALMLVLRYAHFASGGSGGSLGVSLLLNNWNGYNQLPEMVQRILAVFTSNLTLFWLWNLLLLYLGACFALGGRPVAVLFIIALWIAAATIVPAFVGTPQTRTSPRTTTTATQTQANTTRTNSSSTTTTTGTTSTSAQAEQGFPAGGQPPSGAFPGAPGS